METTIAISDNENETELTDFGAAVAAQSCGFRLKNIRRINSRQCAFIFSDSDELTRVLDQYWSGALTVSAYDFHQRSKALKSQLHQARRL